MIETNVLMKKAIFVVESLLFINFQKFCRKSMENLMFFNSVTFLRFKLDFFDKIRP
ncbi:hypothetical protein HMPREF1514_0032 [Streptococcus sp. AS20]|uniref:Uncharacterized protein n=1 Tax=Streptococcus constellatus subsp. pharyngis SK1060 = CCUG 46377 TaxID=1035184 RepID=F9P4X7_STRCV|nr:hypothetical protein HMPREF1042_0526 [Streptococcus constellatus subsp. pharyngis SK1060 = CCUG 46377]EUB24964.1 hypothetical protein HMPREF1514_0032 [Streptococcus sp. AS20]BBD22229.1 hypothetical protein SCSC_0550 [Streptococcus constellatus subsp. constellatus]